MHVHIVSLNESGPVLYDYVGHVHHGLVIMTVVYGLFYFITV